MAEVEFTIPTVQYGNIKIRMTPQELRENVAAPYDIGVAAMVWLSLATQGFEYGKTLDIAPDFEVTGEYQESSEPEPHPITEVTPEEAEEIIKTLGATTVEPWTKTPAPSTTPKAWDNFDI
jgi:hypothetical protein